jgi:hypothetical protein
MRPRNDPISIGIPPRNLYRIALSEPMATAKPPIMTSNTVSPSVEDDEAGPFETGELARLLAAIRRKSTGLKPRFKVSRPCALKLNQGVKMLANPVIPPTMPRILHRSIRSASPAGRVRCMVWDPYSLKVSCGPRG